MVTVADTGPLRYLVQIGHIELIPQIVGGVIVPAAVRDELSHERTPAAVRQWVAARPTWLDVQPAPDVAPSPLSMLGAGERDVIALADALHAALILMDDRAGVVAARARGFAVIGTLGLLDRAARGSLVDLPSAIARLKATNFRVRPQLLDELLAQHGPR